MTPLERGFISWVIAMITAMTGIDKVWVGGLIGFALVMMALAWWFDDDEEGGEE